MKRFFDDTRKYWNYVVCAAKANLKSEVAGSHLNWLWWILDPLLFMIIYTFVSVVVFGKSQEYLAAFIFIGLCTWNFFQHTVKKSVKAVSSNSSIVSKVYVPKYILIYVIMIEQAIRMLISLSLVAVAMVLYKIPPTVKLVCVIPYFITLFIFTFGCSAILLHFGVFIQDLFNVINAVLRLVFYMSGVFYSIDRIPEPYKGLLLKFNPLALIMNGLRDCMLYNHVPDFTMLGIWFVIGVLLSVIGVNIIYKYENSYVKVM